MQITDPWHGFSTRGSWYSRTLAGTPAKSVRSEAKGKFEKLIAAEYRGHGLKTRATKRPSNSLPAPSSLHPPPIALHPCHANVVIANHLPISRRPALLGGVEQILLHHRREPRPVSGADTQIEHGGGGRVGSAGHFAANARARAVRLAGRR